MNYNKRSQQSVGRLALKRKRRLIPMNDVWIAAQCLERGWVLVTDDTDFDYVDGLMVEFW
jgi:tRNA(fMet)-specific endonuclease VapC